MPGAQSGAGGRTGGFPASLSDPVSSPTAKKNKINNYPKTNVRSAWFQTALNVAAVASWEACYLFLMMLSAIASPPPSPSPCSTPKPKNRPPSPAAPKSRPLSPLVPAAASKTPTGKKTPPPTTSGAKTRPKRAQTPARVQPQAVAAVNVDKELEVQQSTSTEEKKGECPSLQVAPSHC